MKNNAKKFLALFITAILCVSMLVIPVSADEPATGPDAYLYADVDFDVDTQTLVDASGKGKVTLANAGATIANADVKHNTVTKNMPVLQASGSNVATVTFNEFTNPQAAYDFWNDADGFSFEVLFLSTGTAARGIFGSTETAKSVKWPSNNCGTGFSLAVNASGQPYFIVGNTRYKNSTTGQGYQSLVISNKVHSEEYIHVVCTSWTDPNNGSSRVWRSVFVNGVEYKAPTPYNAGTMGGGAYLNISNAEDAVYKTFTIGGDTAPTAGTYTFTNTTGTTSVADLKIYDKALSADDVAVLYGRVEAEFPSLFENQALSIGEDLTMHFFTDKKDFTNPQMKFTVAGTTKTVAGVEEGEQYRFSFDGIAPQWMGATIIADLIVEDEVIASKSTTIAKYLNDLKALDATALGMTSAQYDALMTLVNDTLVYGGAAQTYKKYSTGALVSAGVTGTEFTPVAAPVGAGKTDGTNVQFTTANMWFDNDNKLLFTFTATDLTAVTFKVKVGAGEETEVPATSIVDNGNGTYSVWTDAIKANAMDAVYTITAYNADTTVDAKVEYSVADYVYAWQNVTVEEYASMVALAKATYNYGLAAKAFVAAMNG